MWFIAILLGLIVASLFYMTWMPGESYQGSLTPLTEEGENLQKSLEGHVRVLAEEIGNRSLFNYEDLQAAAEHIEKFWTDSGFDVVRQPYTVAEKTVANLCVEIPGSTLPEEIVLLGAHYDSVGEDCPGANDNASAVAALLELSLRFRSLKLKRTLRFCAFVNEEPPYYHTESMGSFVYAREAKKRGDRFVAVIAMDTIGSYSNKAGSQRYPFPFSVFYPTKANFLAFVGNMSSASLVRSAVDIFRRKAKFPSEGIAAPSLVPGVSWSDHWSFWQFGYPALMVTDTAPFRYAHYHEQSDTLDKIAFEELTMVVLGLKEVLQGLADQ